MNAIRSSAGRLLAAFVTSLCVVGCSDAEPDSAKVEGSTSTETVSTSGGGTSTGAEPNRPSSNDVLKRELARIDAAKSLKPRDPPDPEELLKRGKKVKVGHGHVYVPRNREPFPTATPAAGGCDSKTYTSANGDVDVAIPHPPGITAKRIGPQRLLVTYKIGEGDEECRAEILELLAEIKDDALPGIGKRFPIDDDRSGQVVWNLPDPLADADTVVASTATKLTKDGVASETAMVRIR
jgi:hypothetical protein